MSRSLVVSYVDVLYTLGVVQPVVDISIGDLEVGGK